MIIEPKSGVPHSADRDNNEVDVGYDTDRIAIFEIDKSFTDYLLCQICFSKWKGRGSLTLLCRDEQGR